MINTPIGSNAFSNSLSTLSNIATKYDSSGPYQTATSPVDGSAGFVLNLRTGWKDYTFPTSGSYLIYSQRYIYQTVVYNSMGDLRASASSATQSTTLSSAQSSLNTVQGFIDDLTPLKNNVYDYSDKGDGVMTIIQLVFIIYYAIVIGCVGAMTLGTVLFAFCGCNRCKCISHIGWAFLTVLMILGFLFSTLMFPLSVVFIESCDLIKLSSLQTNRGIIPADVWSQISVCLIGDGDLYTYKGLNNNIGFAMTAMNSFDIVSQLYNNVTDTLIYNITDYFVSQVRLYPSMSNRAKQPATKVRTRPALQHSRCTR